MNDEGLRSSAFLFSCIWLFVNPWTVAPRLLWPRDSPGKNTGVDSQSLLLEIFPTQGSNQCPLLCRQILYHMRHQGSPKTFYCCCCQVASVVSDSVRPYIRQPTRLPRPWDSPGKNTGVGCHFLLQCMKMKSDSEVAQSCLTLILSHSVPASVTYLPYITEYNTPAIVGWIIIFLNCREGKKWQWKYDILSIVRDFLDVDIF